MDEDVPLFSIVMPTHNRPEYLAEAVASIVAQSFEDWELIVVDDAGLIPAEVPNDPRIQLMRHEASRGPAAARNTGLDIARGKYVAFLDDDDAWTTRRLANALAAHEHATLVVCGEALLGDVPGVDSEAANVSVRTSPRVWLFDQSAPATGRVSVRRDLCPGFDVDYKAAEDLDWWLRVTADLPALGWLESKDWLWRRHDGPRGDIGANRRIEGSRQLIRKHAEFFRTHPKSRAFRHRRIGLLLLEVGRPATALNEALRSMAARPTIGALRLAARAVARMPKSIMNRVRAS